MIEFHQNKLADGRADERYARRPLTCWSKVVNFFHRGTYCVRRCGFYKGNFSIHSKREMEQRGEYDDRTGCNGLPWVAFEGSYYDCCQFVKQNQTYFRIEY